MTEIMPLRLAACDEALAAMGFRPGQDLVREAEEYERTLNRRRMKALKEGAKKKKADTSAIKAGVRAGSWRLCKRLPTTNSSYYQQQTNNPVF